MDSLPSGLEFRVNTESVILGALLKLSATPDARFNLDILVGEA
jgi:hypothetical protein